MLDRFFHQNPLLHFLDKHGIIPFAFPVVTLATTHMNERLQEIEAMRARGVNTVATVTDRRGDPLSKFLKAKEDHPTFFHDGRVLTMAVSMAFAGSETTAVSLAAVFYYLLKNRLCYRRLTLELHEAVNAGVVGNRPSG